MGLKEIEWQCVNQIYLAYDTDKLRAVMNTAVKLWVQPIARNIVSR